jgi:hypothetical protein
LVLSFVHPGGRLLPSELDRGSLLGPTALATRSSRDPRVASKKAAIAVGHKILVIVYHVLSTGKAYDEARYATINTKQEERRKKAAVKTLERMGFMVDLTLDL